MILSHGCGFNITGIHIFDHEKYLNDTFLKQQKVNHLNYRTVAFM